MYNSSWSNNLWPLYTQTILNLIPRHMGIGIAPAMYELTWHFKNDKILFVINLVELKIYLSVRTFAFQFFSISMFIFTAVTTVCWHSHLCCGIRFACSFSFPFFFSFCCICITLYGGLWREKVKKRRKSKR